MHALGFGVGRTLAVGGVEVGPRRHPDDGPHPVALHAGDQALRVGELARVELPGVVLRLPRRVDHDRVERDPVLAVAVRSPPRHVALVLVDVAALPVPVRPLGKQRRACPSAAGSGAAARRACGSHMQVQAQRPGGGRAARRSDLVPARSSSSPGPQVSDPQRPARRSTAATARGRSRPAGCRPTRASPGGSPGPCSGGRRRAGSAARSGRSGSAWRAPSPVSRSPGDAAQLASSRNGAVRSELDRHARLARRARSDHRGRARRRGRDRMTSCLARRRRPGLGDRHSLAPAPPRRSRPRSAG